MWYIVFMDKDSCVIYSGQAFSIEWFFDEKGESQPFEYFSKCDVNQKRKFLLLVQRMGDFGKIMDKTKFTNEDDGIYAFKPQPDRYLSFFMTGKKIVITNAYLKKSQKMPKSEKELALKRRTEYLEKIAKENSEVEK